MKADNRLWRTLHVLIHMSHTQQPMTSQAIAEMLCTNAVVVRRTMAGLRDQGLLHSEKGHGGGWRLVRPLDQITLLDVYQALGSPSLFAIEAAKDSHGCLVEKAVNFAIDDVLEEARQALLERFASIPLSRIETDFQTELEQVLGPQKDCEHHHSPHSHK